MATRSKVLIALVVVALIAVGGGLYLFFGNDSPDEVSLDSAVEGVADRTTTTDTDGSSATTTPTADGLDSTWTVDTSSGEFDFDSASGTFAGFRIKEELAGIGAADAVGRTGDVSGSMTIAGTQVTAAGFEVDLTTLTSNDSRRNSRIQQALETDEFPAATFELTEPIDLGADAADGIEVKATATGDLTIHGTTKSVQIPLEAQLVDGTVVVVGSLDLQFADYGVKVPEAQIVLSVEDHGPLELQLLLTRS